MVGVLFSAAGGLALFLFGLRLLSDALKRAIGGRMRALLERLTGRAYRGVVVGALTSGILQSSSMTMVLLIGLINAGALNLSQGIGVMLGAEIGTTLTAQIIAFKIGHYYLPILAVGFIVSEVFRGKRVGDIGRIILGFGILFLGMSIVSGGLKGLAQSEAVMGLLETCGSNVFLGVLVGAGVTAVIQSSSAMTALVIAMGAAGLVTLPAAIALILGANIGTTVTGLIASIGSSLSSRRLAVTQVLVNVTGAMVFLPFITPYASLVARTASALPRQIANAHTIFNVLVTLLLIPCVGGLVWIVKRLVHGRERPGVASPEYLGQEFLGTPTMAVRQTHKELLRMGKMAAGMLAGCHRGVVQSTTGEISEVMEAEESVDALHDAIDEFLDHIDASNLATRDEHRLHVLHHVATDIERVGDQSVNIAQRTAKLLRSGKRFSLGATRDLDTMFLKVQELYDLALASLDSEDHDLARQAMEIEREVDKLETLYKQRHIERLEQGECDAGVGVLYVEILHNLERIGDHAVNIAGDVLLI